MGEQDEGGSDPQSEPRNLAVTVPWARADAGRLGPSYRRHEGAGAKKHCGVPSVGVGLIADHILTNAAKGALRPLTVNRSQDFLDGRA